MTNSKGEFVALRRVGGGSACDRIVRASDPPAREKATFAPLTQDSASRGSNASSLIEASAAFESSAVERWVDLSLICCN